MTDSAAFDLNSVDKDRLADAIESLPEAERLVIALVYYENLSIDAAAGALGVSPEQIDELHTSAMNCLADRFGGP